MKLHCSTSIYSFFWVWCVFVYNTFFATASYLSSSRYSFPTGNRKTEKRLQRSKQRYEAYVYKKSPYVNSSISSKQNICCSNPRYSCPHCSYRAGWLGKKIQRSTKSIPTAHYGHFLATMTRIEKTPCFYTRLNQFQLMCCTTLFLLRAFNFTVGPTVRSVANVPLIEYKLTRPTFAFFY